MKSRLTTRAVKSAEAAIRQYATQEKEKMQEWKENVKEEVAHELRAIWQAHEGAMEAQRQNFQLELERVGEIFETKTALLESEIKLLKAVGPQPPQKSPPTKGNSTTSSNGQGERERSQTEEREGIQEFSSMEINPANTSPPSQPTQNRSGVLRKSYAQVVKDNPTRSSVEKPWTEVKYTNKKNETAKKGTHNQEPGGRRILFPRKEAQPQKSEEDIMLALNEALQKAGEPASVRVSRIGYSQSGAISALLTEKGDARELLKTRENLLIRAAKSVDTAVIGAEALEHWHRFKVHGMPLESYLGEGKWNFSKRKWNHQQGYS